MVSISSVHAKTYWYLVDRGTISTVHAKTYWYLVTKYLSYPMLVLRHTGTIYWTTTRYSVTAKTYWYLVS